MAKQTINIGASPNDGTGTPLRTSFDYCNQNFTELYTATGPSGNNIVVPGSATITGDLTVDTSTFKVDSTNDRVGFGTATPAAKLDVTSQNNAFNAIQARYNSSNPLIGFGIANSNGYGYLGFNTKPKSSSDTMTYELTNYATQLRMDAGQFRFNIAASGTAGNDITFTTAATIDSSGNVGVGLAASAGKLEVLNNTDTLSNIAAFSNSSRFRAISLLSGASTASRNYYFVAGASSGADQLEIRSSGYASKDPSAATKILSLDQNGYLTLTSGDLIMGTSGRGIDFSATANSSGTVTSEVLNDYEEGTWTGTLKGSVSDPTTPVTATGTYTKIGRQVTVKIGFSNVTTTGASGSVTVSGLPFSNSATTDVGTVGTYLFDLNTGTSVFASAYLTFLYMYVSKTNAAFQDLLHSAGLNRYLYATVTYNV